jgi:hypothetical protein
MAAPRIKRMREAVKFLKGAREASTFERTRFNRPGQPFTGAAEYTEEIKRDTKAYRETWLTPYIDSALNVIEMEIARATGDVRGEAQAQMAMRESWGQLTYGE